MSEGVLTGVDCACQVGGVGLHAFLHCGLPFAIRFGIRLCISKTEPSLLITLRTQTGVGEVVQQAQCFLGVEQAALWQ